MTERPQRRRLLPRPRWLSPALTLAGVLGLLLAVYLLPPDTSLAELRRVGVLRVCVPASQPPLVTADTDRPGFEVELLRALAEDLGVGIAFNVNAAMGRDINPRNWRINRAQCQMIAGGVVASDMTRSYLDTTPPHLETGWALVEPPPPVETLEGRVVGFLAGFSGFDRIAIGRWLRQAGADVDILRTRDELVQGMHDGTLEAAVTESLAARTIAHDNDWIVRRVDDGTGMYRIAFGIWKGDLTLKRAVIDAMRRLEQAGLLAALLDRYELAPIEGTITLAGAPGES